MGDTVEALQLPGGKPLAKVDSWAAFAAWHLERYHFEPKPNNFYAMQRFDAWCAGAQWQRDREPE